MIFRFVIYTIFIKFLLITLSSSYTIIPTKIFAPCPDENPVNFSLYVNTSNIGLIDLDEQNLAIDGFFYFIVQFQSHFSLTVHTESKFRGFWTDLPYFIQSQNICTTIFDPNQFWYNYVKHLEGKERSCPPIKDVPLHFNQVNLSMSLEDFNGNLECGEYRALARIQHWNMEEMESFCFAFYADIECD